MDIVKFTNFNNLDFLALFIFLIIFAFVMIALITKYAGKFVHKAIYKEKSINLLNRSEFKFFNALTNSISSNMYICPKVRISDLIDVDLPEHTSDFFRALNKITSKHVDFVICNKEDFKPIVAFELDGPTHRYEKSIARDKFVDEVFSDAKIPLIHIPVSDFYDYKMLRRVTACV